MFEELPPQKLKRFLAAQYPELSEEKLEELVSLYSELGLFLVRLWMRKHPRSSKMGISTDFDEKL